MLLAVDYPMACNKIFERRVLEKKCLSVMYPFQSNMEERFWFFTTWLDEKLAQGASQQLFEKNLRTVNNSTCTYLQYVGSLRFVSLLGYMITDQKGKLFLSWQTWDLLKHIFLGFKSLCEDFKNTHSGFSIQVNESAVETLFSQIKHTICYLRTMLLPGLPL